MRSFILGFTLVASVMSMSGPAHAEQTPLVLFADRATVMKVDERAATIVIGNPVYADAVVRPGNVMVLTGKTPGSTNLIILDGQGTILSEHMVHVTTDKTDMVIMHKGNQRFTYSCTIRCENSPQGGDSPDYMDNTIAQTRARLDLSVGEASR